MKIGYVQFDPKLGDKEHNLGCIDEYLGRASGFDLVVFPELCNTGYAFNNRQELMPLAEEVDFGETIDFFKKRAQEMGTLIIAGFAERDGDMLFNSTVAAFPDESISIYRKTHLFLNEKDIFNPGDTGFTVLEYMGTSISSIICFDWFFIETWRTLALKGVEIVCMSANLVLPGKAQKAIPVMSMMNRFFIICANRVGTERGLTFTGNSLITDPTGTVICESPADGEDIQSITIDPSVACDKWMTPKNHLFKDRRVDFYELD